MKQILILLTSFLLFQNSTAQIADRVFGNGTIFTANDAMPFAEAIAVKDGKIIYVGSSTGVTAHINTSTIVENLNGRLLIPGLHDVHMHPLEASSAAMGDCVLDPSEYDPEALGDAIYDCNIAPNVNGWVTAAGHSIFTLFDATRPVKEILDDIYPDTPVAILEETSHSVWVNSKALELAGIDEYTADPVGGHIFKTDGEVDGILMDNAGDEILQMALAATPQIDNLHYDGLVEYGLPLLAENGITSICEGRTYWKRNYQDIWQNIKDDGELTCRVVLAPWLYPDETDNNLITALDGLYSLGDNMLRSTQIKCYSDGIIINATAALHEPYNDNLGLPFDKGLNYIDANRLKNLVTSLELKGYDFNIHAIGDRGVTEALDAIAFARNQNGDLGRRHRITHLEVMKSSDYQRFKDLNIIADMQVAGDFTNPDAWSENNFFLGANRSQNFIPLKSVYETGALVTLSSDWDVSSVSPFKGIQNAVTRAPQNLPNVEEAVKAYTINAAYVMNQEGVTGSLQIGKWADLVVVDRNIFTIPQNQIAATKVVSTWLAGEAIYRSTTLATSEADFEKTIQLSPNPASDYLKVNIPNEDLVSLQLYTIKGELLKSVNPMNKNKVYINTAKFANGIYILKAKRKDKQTISGKFSVKN